MTARDALDGATCVVTGGLGFIGSNLALELASAGARVRVIDALVEGHGGNPDNIAGADGIDVVRADVGDAAAVGPAVAGADFLFDLAGQGSHLASARDPELDFHLNAVSHLRFLEVLREVNPTVRSVFASTRQVYGRPAELPASEATPTRPSDVNGVAKLAVEHLYLLHQTQHGLQPVILRLSNVYGPRQHILSDDLGVLPVFIRRALRHEPLTVFGSGDHVRDALHVHDAVEAFVAAAVCPDAVGRVLNVGHRERLTLLEMAETINRVSGHAAAIDHRPWPQEHSAVAIGSSYMSSAQAEEVLGWHPRVSFADGIADTLAWFAEHPERFR